MSLGGGTSEERAPHNPGLCRGARELSRGGFDKVSQRGQSAPLPST
jgi:hypothetical protein